MRPRVKICCISSVEEARMAVAQGAAALGLVSRMPSGPGVISEKLIAEIAAQVPPGVATFLLTSEIEAEPIIAQQKRTRVSTLQLVDKVAEGTHARLRDALPGIALVQVVHVTGEDSVDEAVDIAPEVDAIPQLGVEPADCGRVREAGVFGRRAAGGERWHCDSPSSALWLGFMQRCAHEWEARCGEAGGFL